MPRTKAAQPRPGDQPLLIVNRAGQEVPAHPVAPTRKPLDKPAFSGVDPEPHVHPRRGKGPVRQWFNIRGARGKIWVHATSAKDAIGTYKVSPYCRPWDDERPVWLGGSKIDLDVGEAGLYRIGPKETNEVVGPQGQNFRQAA